MRKPDFMIVGAPKCGTTALSSYLASHPGVCFSDSKEPNFFCRDFHGYCNSSTEEEYLEKEFRHCNDPDQIIGEGSVWYLYSRVAIERILRFNPDIKLIVMLRDPVDTAQSLHSQMLANLDEDIADFESAWHRQAARANGESIPPLCRESSFLQYREVVRYGEQIQRLFKQVPRAQIRIIFFEDFRHDTRGIYLTMLEFLGLADDGKSDFPRINESRQVCSRVIARLAHRPPDFIKDITARLKKATGIQRFGLSRMIATMGDRLNTRPVERSPVPRHLRKSIQQELESDITLLEELTGRDLHHWRNT